MSGCGCQTEICECGSPLHGWFLGELDALSPEQATEQVFPAAQVRGRAGHSAEDRNLIRTAVASGYMVNPDGSPAMVPGTSHCSAAQGTGISSNLKLAQTASGLALQGTTIGLVASGAEIAASAAFAPITMGISALIGLFPLFFGHHAKAVKQEQSVLCTAVPAANNYLKVIDQAVHSGYFDPQHGIDALSSLMSDFNSAVAGIRHGSDPMSSGECNAACIMATQLHAIVLEKSSEYQDLIAGAAQMVTPSRPNVTQPAGATAPASSYASFYAERGAPVPVSSSESWLPIAALVVAGFFFLRSV